MKFPEGLEGLTLDGIELQYVHPGAFVGTLSVITFSPDDWSRARDDVVAALARLGARRLSTSDSSEPQELFAVPLDDAYVHQYVLIKTLGDATVVLRTSSAQDDSSGAELNPLMRQETFTAAAAELRRYAE